MNQLEYDTYILHRDEYIIWSQGLSPRTGMNLGRHTFTYNQFGSRKLKCPHGHITPYCYKSFYAHQVRGTLYLRDVKQTKPNFDTVDVDSPKILNWV